MAKIDLDSDRLNIAHMVRKTAERSDYHIYEVEDVLKAFYDIMREELYKGKSILFERLFRAQIKKPKSRKIYNPKTGKFYDSPAHPRLVVKPTIGLLDYIREQPDTTLKVKRNTPSKRLQHHTNPEQKEYYIAKPKQKAQEEFPNPI